MAFKNKGFYCYLDDNDQPIVTDVEPEGFLEKPNKSSFMAPNLTIAKAVYDTNLKISKEREKK